MGIWWGVVRRRLASHTRTTHSVQASIDRPIAQHMPLIQRARTYPRQPLLGLGRQDLVQHELPPRLHLLLLPRRLSGALDGWTVEDADPFLKCAKRPPTSTTHTHTHTLSINNPRTYLRLARLGLLRAHAAAGPGPHATRACGREPRRQRIRGHVHLPHGCLLPCLACCRGVGGLMEQMWGA